MKRMRISSSLPPSLHFCSLPNPPTPHYALEVVRSWRERCTGSLYNCKESTVQYHHYSGRTVFTAAAAAPMKASCNYLSSLKEQWSFCESNQTWAPLSVSVMTVSDVIYLLEVSSVNQRESVRRILLKEDGYTAITEIGPCCIRDSIITASYVDKIKICVYSPFFLTLFKMLSL